MNHLPLCYFVCPMCQASLKQFISQIPATTSLFSGLSFSSWTDALLSRHIKDASSLQLGMLLYCMRGPHVLLNQALDRTNVKETWFIRQDIRQGVAWTLAPMSAVYFFNVLWVCTLGGSLHVTELISQEAVRELGKNNKGEHGMFHDRKYYFLSFFGGQ